MKNKIKDFILPTVITVPFIFLYYYVALPAINWRSYELWLMIVIAALVFGACYFASRDKSITKHFTEAIKKIFADASNKGGIAQSYHDKTKKFSGKGEMALIILCAVLLLVILVCFFTSSVVFRAKDYQSMLDVNESDFSKDIAELPISQIPIVDRDTAERLGNRKLGEIVELVSQFNVSNYYTQINYNNAPYRVSPLEYAGFLKWISNKDEGIPYYVSIDMSITQETSLVHLEEGMRYSPSEYFGRDLKRHIRFAYPTKMFEDLSFEIDDNGNPYWVMSYYNYTFGIVGGKDIEGIILVDAVSGEMTDYKVADVPQWIDTVYSADMLIEQANNWGTLTNGFLNSIFVQKNCVVTTEGYNYIAVNDDVWLYTGITSVVADESNIGFILINMRTKEAKTYMINGAEEYSAMESAQGQIQEKGYVATFPILINVANKPTYFISLKDNAGLVKAYSFVSVADYQIVGVADTIDGAKNEYLRMLGITDIPAEGNSFAGTVSDIATAVKNGNSLYYLLVDGDVYVASISISDMLPFIKIGDNIEFKADAEGKITEIKLAE